MINGSILNSVKELLGIESEVTDFDQPILSLINSAIIVLLQFGIGPSYGFEITSEIETYSDYLGESSKISSLVNKYIYCYVKKNFDTPQTSGLISALDEEMRETEWRLILFSDNKEVNRETEGEDNYE